MSDPGLLRLAMRSENGMWNAYLAKADTMEDAVLIGSIAIGIIQHSQERKEAFVALMQASLNDMLMAMFGEKIEAWQERVERVP
jgi:hypothetical protein